MLFVQRVTSETCDVRQCGVGSIPTGIAYAQWMLLVLNTFAWTVLVSRLTVISCNSAWRMSYLRVMFTYHIYMLCLHVMITCHVYMSLLRVMSTCYVYAICLRDMFTWLVYSINVDIFINTGWYNYIFKYGSLKHTLAVKDVRLDIVYIPWFYYENINFNIYFY